MSGQDFAARRRAARARRGNQEGFTLVEMAIVLVIIGLIIGGILKGQEIVDNARVKSQVSQIDSIKAAVATFVDEYNYYPGDDPIATQQLGSVAGTNGNGDGFISNSLYTPIQDNQPVGQGEINWVWYHLQIGQLISGIPTGNPATPIQLFSNQGKIASSYLYLADFEWIGAAGPVTNKMIRIQGNNSDTGNPTPVIRVADANQIDIKYDDGSPSTGEILAGTYSQAQCCAGSACTGTAAAYGLPVGASSASPYCALLWQIQ